MTLFLLIRKIFGSKTVPKILTSKKSSVTSDFGLRVLQNLALALIVVKVPSRG